MNELQLPASDLWRDLAARKCPVVLYGMGNGADKILRVCDTYGIKVSDFFASDGFVRGHQFHGKTVLSYSAVREKYGDGRFVTLVSFATKLPEVMERIRAISRENELYIPDVPVFGEELFNLEFALAHEKELRAARGLLADERSREVYDAIVRYRLSGRLDDLEASACSRNEVTGQILRPDRYRVTADLGAYNGDTIRELLAFAPGVRRIYAMEPDARTYRKLTEYAKAETRAEIFPIEACAWNEQTTLFFDASGNRNSNVKTEAGGSERREVKALPLDSLFVQESVDYIKYDVEGSEAEALAGSAETIRRCHPDLLVSLYHRSTDLFRLTQDVHSLLPDARLYLRRFPYFPAWDLNLYAVSERN